MAGDYIRRDLAKKRFSKRLIWLKEDVHDEYSGALLDGCEADIELLDEIPAADVAEVVHGRWIDGAEDFTCGNHNAECSICRCYVSWDGCDEDFNYCPNCGAKMDGGDGSVAD